MKCRHPFALRIAASFLCVLLAFAFVPAGLLPARSVAAAAEEGDSTTVSTRQSLIAQAEADGTCSPHQALVVYHLSGASKGSTGDISVQSDSDPLADAGFSTSNIWDFSAADSLVSEDDAAADGVLSVQSEDTGAALASGSDVRVALVERDDLSTADLVESLESLDFVECAQPNFTYASTATITDDTYATLLDNLSGSASAINGFDSGMGYSAALKKDTTSTTSQDENVVAVLDSGVDYNNPDLEGQMWDNPGGLGIGPAGTHGFCSVDNTYDPRPRGTSFEESHGTHCAGIIAAQVNNKEGVAGVAGANGHTKIMGIRASEEGAGFSSISITDAYEYLLKARIANVNVVAVNNSWGGSEAGNTYSPVLDYLINQAGKAGIISVFAAGNEPLDAVNQYNTIALSSPYAIMVAASNKTGGLAAFSSYNETRVDVAAPGVSIVSTVANSTPDAFSALRSRVAGKTLEYYTDIAGIANGTPASGETGYTAEVTDKDGVRIDNADVQSAFTCATDDGSGTAYTSFGQSAVRVTLDCDAVRTAGYDPENVRVAIKWTIANPFLNRTDLTASDYSVNVSADKQDNVNSAVVYESLLDEVGNELVTNGAEGKGSDSFANNYNSGVDDGALTGLATSSNTLSVRLLTKFTHSRFDTVSEITGTQTCYLTAYGIGRNTNPLDDADSERTPYACMSGTSMAAPEITGAVAELAALNPTSTPLQLRGMVCGGTVPLSNATDQGKIASGGRFSFEAALNSSSVCPSTWSITTSGKSITVHGYALDGANLYVDGSSTPVSFTSRTDDEITFDGSAILDGTAHRIDVGKEIDGVMRVYNASYFTPSVASDSLVRVGNLPTTVGASTGTLVSTKDRMFLVDSVEGSYLYGCSDPSVPGASWTKLAAPGTPWTQPRTSASNAMSPMKFATLDGILYAFASNQDAADKTKIDLYCATYDISSNTWTPFEIVCQQTLASILDYCPIPIDGSMRLLVSLVSADHSSYTASMYSKNTSGGYDEVALADSSGTLLPVEWASVGGGFSGLGIGVLPNSPTTTALHLVSYDSEKGELVSMGAVKGFESYNDIGGMSFFVAKISPVSVGNGFVITIPGISGMGDMQLIGSDATATKLGSFGITASSGYTVSSMNMFGGRLYLNCSNHAEGDAVGIYTLPASAASALQSTDVTASVSTDGSGSASVADWLSESTSEIDVRSCDTVTWTASAEAGHHFVGWLDSNGGLVSSDVTYSSVVTAGTTLVATFAANDYQVSFDANGGSGDMASQTMTYGVSAALSANTLARDGYVFVGWNTKADGSGASYADGATVSNLAESGSVTLYAQWKVIPTSPVSPATPGASPSTDDISSAAAPTASTVPRTADATSVQTVSVIAALGLSLLLAGLVHGHAHRDQPDM